jgi:hypothetical protein
VSVKSILPHFEDPKTDYLIIFSNIQPKGALIVSGMGEALKMARTTSKKVPSQAMVNVLPKPEEQRSIESTSLPHASRPIVRPKAKVTAHKNPLELSKDTLSSPGAIFPLR